MRRSTPFLFLAMGLIALVFLIAPTVLSLVIPSPIRYVGPFPVEQRPYHGGEAIRVKVYRCNDTHDPLAYSFDRSLQPDTEGLSPVILVAGTSTIPPGCQTVASRLNIIPPGTAPGRYHIVAVTHVKGQWRTYDVPWSSESFDVVP